MISKLLFSLRNVSRSSNNLVDCRITLKNVRQWVEAKFKCIVRLSKLQERCNLFTACS